MSVIFFLSGHNSTNKKSTINLYKSPVNWFTISVTLLKMNLLPFLAFITSTAATSFPLERSLNPQPRATSDNYRLPTHVYPVHYDLTLEPNFSNFSFAGEASIELQVTEETNNITLHAYNLTVSVEGVSFGDVEIENVDYVEDYQFLIISLGRNVSQGSYVLNIIYEGYLNSNNRGFYRGNYQDSDGGTRYVLTQNFVSLILPFLSIQMVCHNQI